MNKGAYINNGRQASSIEKAMAAINYKYAEDRTSLMERADSEGWSDERLQHELDELGSEFMRAKRQTCNTMLNK